MPGSSLVRYLETLPIEWILGCDSETEYDLYVPITDEIEMYLTINRCLKEDFGSLPFYIGMLFKDLIAIDKPMTDEKVIIIYDGRISADNPYYANFTDKQRAKLCDYMLVKRPDDDTPITIRQIITQMRDNRHYNKTVIKEDFNNVLNGFKKTTTIQYTAVFGQC